MSTGSRRLTLSVIVACLLATEAVWGQGTNERKQWVGSWAASQQTPETANLLDPELMRDATLRQMMHLSVGGNQLRVRLSNAFGTQPLHLMAVHVARPGPAGGSAIDVGSDTAVMFHGAADVMIPAGAEYVSDAVTFSAAALSSLVISIHYEEPPVGETGHPGSRATSYVAHGDLVSAASLPDAKTVEHWYQISVSMWWGRVNRRRWWCWGTRLRMGMERRRTRTIAGPMFWRRGCRGISRRGWGCVNQGIGGNRLLLDGLGPNALARFDRDVVAQTAVRVVIVLEGVNDLGTLTRDHDAPAEAHAALVKRIEGAYQQMIARAHAHGIRVIGATILPYGGSKYYHPGPESEADRQAINAWIRESGHFDNVLDFDALMRDPAHPNLMLPAYDSGDGLHPGPAGYKAMGDAIPLTLLKK